MGLNGLHDQEKKIVEGKRAYSILVLLLFENIVIIIIIREYHVFYLSCFLH